MQACDGVFGIHRARVLFRARKIDPMRLENDFLRFLGRGGLSAVFFNPAIENLNRINAGHPVFLIQQLEALRGVSKVHPHFSLRKQLNDNIETEIVRVADAHHVFPDFARQ